MINYIKEVEKNVSIEEGRIAIEQFLINVYLSSPISNKFLARKLYLPIPLVTAIKKEFIKLEIVKQEKGITITPLGIQYVEEVLGFKNLDKDLYQRLLEDRPSETELFKDELRLIETLFMNRPQADVSIDQTHCTFQTSLKRSLLALRHHTLINKRILCIGDDDLVSISLGLLLRKLYGSHDAHQTEIHVVDIDKRYLEYIEEIADIYDLPIHCHQVNLRNPLESKLIAKFDCFYTDPPYTINGMDLFLSRGIAGLKKSKGLPVFFSFAHKSYDSAFEVTKRLCDMGLSIHNIIQGFNVYEGASVIGNIGQMLILYTTSHTQPLIPSNKVYSKPLYTREVKLQGCG